MRTGVGAFGGVPPRSPFAMALHSVNLQLVINEYIVKMLNEAGVGMKCLVLDDFTVRKLTHVSQIQVYRPCPRPYASLLTTPPVISFPNS